MVRLFIVDDAKVLEESYRRVIDELHGVRLVGISSEPSHAWREIVRSRPDVVIVDLQLGKICGISLLKRIKTQWPGTRVIMTSGSLFTQYEDYCMRAGADGYVAKSEDMVEALERILCGWGCPVMRRPD